MKKREPTVLKAPTIIVKNNPGMGRSTTISRGPRFESNLEGMSSMLGERENSEMSKKPRYLRQRSALRHIR